MIARLAGCPMRHRRFRPDPPVLDLERLPRQLLDVAQQMALVAAAERDRDALGAGACRPADTMDIALRHFRQLEIDDMGHAVDIDAARGDVGRDHHADLAGAEGGESPLPLALALIAVNGRGGDLGRFEMARHLVGAMLGPGEDDGPSHRFVLEELDQHLALARRLDQDGSLADALGGGGDGRHGNLHRIGQQLGGELADLLRQRRREEQVAPAGRKAGRRSGGSA